ncbi:MAG TPA: trypsin-like peptidase domain-containing protein [Pseudonocardia sp.]
MANENPDPHAMPPGPHDRVPPAGVSGHGGGPTYHGDPYTGPYRTVGYPAGNGPGYPPPAPPPPRWGTGRLVAIGLAGVLLAGGVGGSVGYSLAESRQTGGSSGVLGAPLPEVADNALPIGPVEAVAERVLPSVVQLRVEGAGSSGEGSAMVLSADGLLLTNNHVVEPAANRGRVTAVFQNGATAQAAIVGRDPSSDLALIRAQGVTGLTTVELGNSDSVRVGQQVVAFGSPLGLGGTVTTGIISALNRPVSVGGDQAASEATVLNALQTDAAINPGNSGGPLVDMQGRVIGINSAIATTGEQGGSIGVGFSVPINQAKRVAEELERTGKASRAVLGVNVSNDPQVSGARIQGVAPGSAAEVAGIKAGDLVIAFNGQRILAGDGLQAAVRSRAPGEVVVIQLADRSVSVTLGAAS